MGRKSVQQKPASGQVDSLSFPIPQFIVIGKQSVGKSRLIEVPVFAKHWPEGFEKMTRGLRLIYISFFWGVYWVLLRGLGRRDVQLCLWYVGFKVQKWSNMQDMSCMTGRQRYASCLAQAANRPGVPQCAWPHSFKAGWSAKTSPVVLDQQVSCAKVCPGGLCLMRTWRDGLPTQCKRSCRLWAVRMRPATQHLESRVDFLVLWQAWLMVELVHFVEVVFHSWIHSQTLRKACGQNVSELPIRVKVEGTESRDSGTIALSCCYINILFMKQNLKPTRKGLLSKNAVLKLQVRTALILDSWIFLASGGAVGWWMGSGHLWKVAPQVVRQRRRHAAVGQEDRYSRFQVYVGISSLTCQMWRLHEIS